MVIINSLVLVPLTYFFFQFACSDVDFLKSSASNNFRRQTSNQSKILCLNISSVLSVNLSNPIADCFPHWSAGCPAPNQLVWVDP